MQSHEFQTTLGEIASFRRGVSYRSSDLAESEDDGTLMINLKSFTQEGEYRPEGIKFHNGKFKKESFIKPNEIVIANTCQTRGGELLGAAVMIPSNFHGKQVIGSHHTTILTITHDSVIPRYILYVLNSPRVREKVKQYKRGALIQGILTSDLKKIMIKIPPLEEQEKIAVILDKADEINQNTTKAQSIRDEIIRSSFFEMFGDPTTNPKEFEIRLIKELYINEKNGTKCGPFGSALKKKEYVEGGIPVWNMNNITKNGDFIDKPSLWITEEKFFDLGAYSVSDGDVIISRAGTVGKMSVVRSEHNRSIISSNLIRIRFGPNILPEYFVYLMTICKGRVGRLRTGSDGSFTHMNTGVLDKLKIPCPPIKLQNQFIDIVDQLNAIEFSTLESYSISVKESLTQDLLA